MQPRSQVSDLNFDLRRISEIATSTPGCIRSDLGQLNYPAPESIKNLIAEQAKTEKFEYAPTLGTSALLNALKTFEAPLMSLFSDTEILVTSGGQAALFAALSAFVGKDETILTDQLYYPPYASIATLIGAKLQAKDLSVLDVEALDTVKVLLLNTPHNPSGKVYSSFEVERLSNLAKKHDWLVIEDRVYDRLYETEMPPSMVKFAPERTLVINSASKNFCMPGMRLGWIFGESDLVMPVAKVHRNMNSCPNTLFQSVLAKFLPECETFFQPLRAELQTRKQLLLQGFKHLGWPVEPSHGGIYVIVNLPNNVDGEVLVERLIKEVGVSAIPGGFFGGNANSLRFCFGALSASQITEMFERLTHFKI